MSSAEPAEPAKSSEVSARDPRFDEDSPEFDPPGPDWLYRWRTRVIGKSRIRQIAWRTFITVVGGAITLAGIGMLVLPGPGWAAIFLGLAILASEYLWARRLLTYTKDRAQGAASAVLAKENRGLALALGAVFLLLAAAVISWYVYRYGWTFDGVLGWFGRG
ncbi:MAG: PGPGW domain-containing protein [Actinomycetes bacterium]